jgi:hypothetical protein
MQAEAPPPIDHYAADFAYLSQHVKVVELSSGTARVAFVPHWQGRVMTCFILSIRGSRVHG